MKNRLFPTNPLPLCKPLRFVQFGQESCLVKVCPVRPRVLSKGLSSSAKSLVQLGNTFIQSGCGCLKKCLQLSKLLPLPSHKFSTHFQKSTQKKKKGLSSSAKSLVQLGNTLKHRWRASSATCRSSSFSRHDTFTSAIANAL